MTTCFKLVTTAKEQFAVKNKNTSCREIGNSFVTTCLQSSNNLYFFTSADP